MTEAAAASAQCVLEVSPLWILLINERVAADCEHITEFLYTMTSFILDQWYMYYWWYLGFFRWSSGSSAINTLFILFENILIYAKVMHLCIYPNKPILDTIQSHFKPGLFLI